MNRRQLKITFLITFVLTVLSIFLLDRPIAAFAQRAGGRESPLLLHGTEWLEIASGFPIHRYFLTFLFVGLGLFFFIWRSTRSAAWVLLFVGCTHIVIRLTAGTLKNVFHRLRPFEVIQAGDWDWKFFGDHGSSFPSGHAAHFWGLFFPLAFLFPRYRWPLLILPVFISVARVGVNDHWCSDVIASAAIAALLTVVFSWLFRMKPASAPPRESPNPKATDSVPI